MTKKIEKLILEIVFYSFLLNYYIKINLFFIIENIFERLKF